MILEGKEVGRGEKVQVFRILYTRKWGARRANKGQEEEGGCGDEGGVGYRIWRKDWKRRMWFYDTLVWTVAGYGVEIWGWKEREEMERIHERYMRWTMGLNRMTPGYMIREELGRELMRTRAGKRAWNFEKRLKEGKGGEMARRCWEEMRGRWRRGKIIGKWEKEREEFRSERGIGEEEEDRIEYSEIEVREKERQAEERWRKIRDSRSNKWYKEIKREGIPIYLKKGWSEERWRRIIRF
jgi:hypothetical protein